MNSNLTNRIKVWDLPTRLFHWLLVALFIAAWITAELLHQAVELVWLLKMGKMAALLNQMKFTAMAIE